MPISTASSTHRTPLIENRLLWVLSGLMLVYWVYGWFNCLILEDWALENALVIICIGIMIWSRKWHSLSDASYLCIFAFVMLHLFGAFYAYTQNIVGEWIQNTWNLWRNPYDRIVHFSFGFLMAYPYREILINKFKVSSKAAWFIPIEIAFSLGTIFEMIEWAVAEFATRELGETYVATQGDVWDAHKDIALAGLGAAIAMGLVYLFKKGTGKQKSVSL